MRTVPRHLYPFDGKRIDIDGHSMHYLDEGAGEPVVMVHGNPTWSFYYRNLVTALSPTHRCIVPDHIGMGMSDKPSADVYPYTIERRVADFGRFMESLQLEGPINLVVHDWGGMIGMTWATRNPALIKRLIILNTAAFPLPQTREFHLPLRFTRTRIGGHLVLQHNAFARGATHFCVKRRRMPKEVRRAYTAPYDSKSDRIATLRFVQDIPLSPADEGYALISATRDGLVHFRDTPTRIFWGAKDFVFDDSFLDEWKHHLPEAEVMYFTDCGHYVLEDAVEEIVPEIQHFLSVPVA